MHMVKAEIMSKRNLVAVVEVVSTQAKQRNNVNVREYNACNLLFVQVPSQRSFIEDLHEFGDRVKMQREPDRR